MLFISVASECCLWWKLFRSLGGDFCPLTRQCWKKQHNTVGKRFLVNFLFFNNSRILTEQTNSSKDQEWTTCRDPRPKITAGKNKDVYPSFHSYTWLPKTAKKTKQNRCLKLVSKVTGIKAPTKQKKEEKSPAWFQPCHNSRFKVSLIFFPPAVKKQQQHCR